LDDRRLTRDAIDSEREQDATARLAAIISSTSDAIIGKTLDGIVTSWNKSAERIFGYSAAEMVGSSIYRLIPEELHGSERELLERLSGGEGVELSEAERIRKDGTRIWISLSVSPIRDTSGRVTGAASIKRDITARKQVEAQLREHQEQLELAHRAARMGTWRWEIAANLLRWDEGLRRLYELAPDEQVSGYDDFILRVHPDDRESVGQSVQAALTGSGRLDHEFRIILPGERIRWLADLGRVALDPSGKPIYLTGVCMDVTERRAVEERLRDTQRLQAVGQLAGGIAHEANNQMLVVMGAAHFLLRRSELPESARADVEQIRQAAERTALVTQQLLAFSRRQVLQLQSVDLTAVVLSIEPVLRRLLAEGQRLVVRPGVLGEPVRLDPRQFEQVLLNLTLNARDAMRDGGELTIETRLVEVAADDSVERDAPSPGTYAALIVEDSGHGMDSATLQRIFEPFFTTKSVGQGSGLGLAVVHGIVHQSGGHIRVESEPGRGSRFSLYFPVQAHSPAPMPPASEPVMPVQGTMVLLVEDDPQVRVMATRTLTEAGYDVLEAENGRAALELVRHHPRRVDLVIADIGMPEMGGHDLARRLHEERPELPVVFISGYGSEKAESESNGAGETPFLQKPFAPDVLVRTVAEVLAAVS
jgi:PAS domain S-box-containing protein